MYGGAPETLKAEDLSELIDMLNFSFTGNKRSGHFEYGLPKLLIKDDIHAEKHLVIREKGKIVAAIGIYPLETIVAGEKLLFSTVGNVATLPEARAAGCMKRLMNAAMERLDVIGADASRLSGIRSRFSRYGYEIAGAAYRIKVTARNADEYVGGGEYEFKAVESENDPVLDDIRRLCEKPRLHVMRGDNRELYSTLCAWSNLPYAVYNKDGFAGYLCVGTTGSEIAEQNAVDYHKMPGIISSWIKMKGVRELYLTLYPWEPELYSEVSAFCEGIETVIPSHFKLINWDRVTSAFMKLKLQLQPMYEGSVTIGIKDYGRIECVANGGEAFCVKTDKPCDIVLDPMTAIRVLYGQAPAYMSARLPKGKEALFSSWFPLPLSWNGQDRI